MFLTLQDTFVAPCRCREDVKLFRFLLSPHYLRGTHNSVQNYILLSVQEHFLVCCRCREGAKLFRFLLSLYSLIGTCNSVQNCTSLTGGDRRKVSHTFEICTRAVGTEYTVLAVFSQTLCCAHTSDT
jgi:hypothetical protein